MKTSIFVDRKRIEIFTNSKEHKYIYQWGNYFGENDSVALSDKCTRDYT